MILKKLTIQNFLSIRSITLDLDNQGLVLLKGRNLDNESLNNNGAGKSSIIEALVYALYGRTLRGLKGDSVIHRTPKKNMKVFLDLVDDDGTEYRIARYRKHSTNKNKSLLYRNSKDITPKSEADFNTYVADLLQADYLTFTSSLLYSAESFRFTSATDAEMKSTFDTMLGLDVYQRCQDIAKARLKEVESSISSVEWKVDDRRSRIDELDRKIAETQDDYDEYELERESRLNDLKAQLENAEKQVKLAEDGVFDSKMVLENAEADKDNAEKVLAGKRKKLEKVDELREALQDIKDEIREHERSINVHERSIDDSSSEFDRCDRRITRLLGQVEEATRKKFELDDGIGKPCPTCGQPLTSECMEPARAEYDDKIAEYQSEIDSIRSKMADLNADIEAAQEEINAENDEIEELERTQQEFETLIKRSRKLVDERGEAEEALQEAQSAYYRAEADVRVAEKTLKQARKQVGDVEQTLQDMSSENPYERVLAKYRSEQEAYGSEVEGLLASIKDSLDERECLEFWVKAYSNQGIKSFILDDITPFLNRRANKYLAQLTSGHIEVKFNTQTTLKSGETREKFSIEVINQDGGQEYSANSGGERKRVDLAINMAMQDLVSSRSNKKINIAIFDEAFDALDEVGVEKVIELLQGLSDEKSSIFVISHNEHLQSYFTNVLTVVKQDGFSRLESGDPHDCVDEDESN